MPFSADEQSSTISGFQDFCLGSEIFLGLGSERATFGVNQREQKLISPGTSITRLINFRVIRGNLLWRGAVPSHIFRPSPTAAQNGGASAARTVPGTACGRREDAAAHARSVSPLDRGIRVSALPGLMREGLRPARRAPVPCPVAGGPDADHRDSRAGSDVAPHDR